jgi:RimJ/RimL family protein N-acetyltransferase
VARLRRCPRTAAPLGKGRVRRPGVHGARRRAGRRHAGRPRELEDDQPQYSGQGICYEIGLALLPEHRGHGLGTAAQRLLVDYLFEFTAVHRLEALTSTENFAEQKALERAGFQREGVTREVIFHRGAWRDLVIYALLRDG